MRAGGPDPSPQNWVPRVPILGPGNHESLNYKDRVRQTNREIVVSSPISRDSLHLSHLALQAISPFPAQSR
ncbi:hypothetical protein SBA5_100079 [Candidatus Sulfotelmatomonas gaucii]|uniref:Uncharacterized protein n=1 Tax=Candidatus Sulfuritelmatomonas gaucii TaxID=2043161 RepID=A0A2N9L2P6_9BACT|nr:hypothetical protein SBA5_100079 [Candidatus Sulfotelmatomonas gaucii]